jgi:spore coat polysaccharide biosynthesis protein SpsF
LAQVDKSKDGIVAIVQARMASTRLPGKVITDIAGQPMLARVVVRARRSKRIDRLVVATSIEPKDDPIVELCEQMEFEYSRGSALDVLDRCFQAAREFEAHTVVRLTADCPLIDPDVIDQTIEAFFAAEPPADFAANRFSWERTFPIGLDVEVCTMEALETAWREADEQHQREHVMPFLYEKPDRFHILHVRNDEDYGHMRWTVDTDDDLAFVREIYKRFRSRDDFNWREILELLEKEPELAQINAHVQHKSHLDVG